MGNKKAVVNIKKNKENHCFWWSIVAAANPVDIHPERPGNYPQQAIKEFDRGGIDSSVPISQIPRAERQNNRAVNVFGWDKGVDGCSPHQPTARRHAKAQHAADLKGR